MDKIKYAEQFTKDFDQNGVIMFHVDNGRLGYTSYGKDKAWCERMRNIADALWDDFTNAYAQNEREDNQLGRCRPAVNQAGCSGIELPSGEQEKFLAEYESLCRKHQLIIDSQYDVMFIVVPEAVIGTIPRPIPGTGTREYENYEEKTQSIDEHIAYLRGNS